VPAFVHAVHRGWFGTYHYRTSAFGRGQRTLRNVLPAVAFPSTTLPDTLIAVLAVWLFLHLHCCFIGVPCVIPVLLITVVVLASSPAFVGSYVVDARFALRPFHRFISAVWSRLPPVYATRTVG
jgi:hypothetical protein